MHNHGVIVPRALPRVLFALGLGFGAGCFDSGDQVECPVGTSGCVCRDDGSCNGSLDCNADGNCVDPNCVEGTQACPCYGNGSCDSGLTCTGNICQPGSGGSTGSPPSTTSGNDSGPGDSTTDGGSTAAVDSGDTVADIDSGPADTGTGSCPRTCGVGQACEVTTGQCVDTAYGPCSPELDLCQPPAVCDDLGGNSFVCATPCVEATPMCPTEPTAEIVCVEVSGCQIPCDGDDDCPPYEGMGCHDKRCAYPA